MSDLRGSDLPPVGEEIHLPSSSATPALASLGLMLVLLGVVGMLWLTAIGLVILVLAVIAWVRDATREMRSLPVHDDH